MKKLVAVGIFGGSLGLMISAVSPYSATNGWQWWAAFVPVLLIGVIYGNIPRD